MMKPKILESGQFYDHVLKLAKQKTWNACVFSTYGMRNNPTVDGIMDALSGSRRTRRTMVVGIVGGKHTEYVYGSRALQMYSFSNLHSKFFVFDNGNMVFGSHNLTSSKWIDHSVAFRDKPAAMKFMRKMLKRIGSSE